MSLPMNSDLKRRGSCILSVGIKYKFLTKKMQTGGKAETYQMEMKGYFQPLTYKRRIRIQFSVK